MESSKSGCKTPLSSLVRMPARKKFAFPCLESMFSDWKWPIPDLKTAILKKKARFSLSKGSFSHPNRHFSLSKGPIPIGIVKILYQKGDRSTERGKILPGLPQNGSHRSIPRKGKASLPSKMAIPPHKKEVYFSRKEVFSSQRVPLTLENRQAKKGESSKRNRKA